MHDPLATNDRAGLDRGIRRWFAVAAVTFVLGQVERLFHHSGETFGTLLLTPGCVLPMLFWWGSRYWSAAFCGAIATLLLQPGLREVAKQYSAISVPVLAAGFALELVITVWLLRAWGVRQDLSRGRDAMFLMLAALVGTSVSGCGAFPILYGPEGLPPGTLLKTCATWWLMLFVSIVVFAPGCLTWRRWLSSTRGESAALAAILGGLLLLESIGLRLWSSHELIASPLFYISLPLVLWGVLRYGLRAAAVVSITTACLSAFATARGFGPVAEAEPLLANLDLNLFLLSFGATFNLIGCFSEESRVALERLKIEHDQLSKADRTLAEQKLQEGELRYRMLADYAGDLICRIRDDGTFAYASPACRTMLGYEPEELMDDSMDAIVSPEDRDYCAQMLQRLIAGEEQLTVPFRGLKKDGSIVWLEGKSQRLAADSGRCEVLCVIRDVTERRSLEVQVAQAQRLEAIGRLAGGIAHDFNNILTVINGYAEILETRFTADDPESKFVANILEAGRRAAVLTRQLLTYSRKQLVTHGPVNLNDLLRKLEPLLKPLMGENTELALELEPDLHLIEGSAGQFEQVIMNLAINACDAMPQGGRLTLGTCNCRVEAAGTPAGRLTPGPYAKLIVADTGQGMSESVKSRMFEPFFTTKQVGEGTGLGLATVYATVEQARGHIAVESQPGAGTQIEILFPAHTVAADSAPAPAPQRKRSVAAIVNRRILVVDDDPHIRSLVEMTLNLANYQVVTASDGDEALQLVESGPQPFDLLLTDVVMKGVNGRELADSLRTRHPQLPVIFMSGHTDDAVLRSGVLHNEVTFLQKPFTAEELTSKVQQVLARQAA
jgi:PAS domain S-box-containing protein